MVPYYVNGCGEDFFERLTVVEQAAMDSAVDSFTWRDVVAKKRTQQQEVIIAHAEPLVPQAVNEKIRVSTTSTQGKSSALITDIDDTVELAGLIAKGKLKSEDVTRAYIARAIEAHNLTNCLTEILFEEAVVRAQMLDSIMVETGKPIGPLHGVPMTLKDQFNVKGHDTTIGYVGRALRPATEDAVLVRQLQDLGAVIICKTNLPQSIMWCETENPLWGLTINPMNPDYTPGGSTGGESALLYGKGSILGWGTDIGGSIRIPAHMLGLYGLKPSSSRIPYFGVAVSTEGQEHVPSSIGPLARSLSSINHVMREIVSNEPWKKDCRCSPLPWRTDVYEEYTSRPLTIGVLLDDGIVRPHPTITRVMKHVTSVLAKDGHEIISWNSDLHSECIDVMDLFYTADGGEDIRRDVQAGGEPFIPHVEKLINRGKAVSVYEYWQLNKRKKILQQAYLEKWNNVKSHITGKTADVLIMPVMPHSAVPHKACRWVGYTKVWNFLDYTALVLPGGKVEHRDCEVPWNYSERNEMDKWNLKVWTENKSTMADMGLPVGVQIIGRQLEEEKVLAVGKVLDHLLREH